MKYYSFCEFGNLLIARTGYTGEIGFEIYIKYDMDSIGIPLQVWDFFVGQGVKVCGLGSRDILRLEAGYPLYGHELGDQTNPIEAGLSWAIDFDKDFIGKDAVLAVKEKGIAKKLVGLELPDRRSIPRHGTKIFDTLNPDKEIGYVTSGSYSFFLEKTIALAYIDSKYAKIDNEVELDIRNRRVIAKITKKSFYYNKDVRS